MKLQQLGSRKVFGLGAGMALLLPAICAAAVPAAPSTIYPQSYGLDACPVISISWNPSSGATSYKLYRSDNGGTFNFVWSGAGAIADQTIPIPGHFKFKVAACNADGCSALSTSQTDSMWGYTYFTCP
jgi:hypothetical protein